MRRAIGVLLVIAALVLGAVLMGEWLERRLARERAEGRADVVGWQLEHGGCAEVRIPPGAFLFTGQMLHAQATIVIPGDGGDRSIEGLAVEIGPGVPYAIRVEQPTP